MYKIQFETRDKEVEGFELLAPEEAFVPALTQTLSILSQDRKGLFKCIRVVSPSKNITEYSVQSLKLPDYIRNTLASRGVTMVRFAQQLGISQPNLSGMLGRAQTQLLSRKNLDRFIATHLFDNAELMKIWVADRDVVDSSHAAVVEEITKGHTRVTGPLLQPPKEHWRHVVTDPETGRQYYEDRPGYDKTQDPNYYEDLEDGWDSDRDQPKITRFYPYRPFLLEEAEESGDEERLAELNRQIAEFSKTEVKP